MVCYKKGDGEVMYFINIVDNTTQKSWCENYDSYYLFRKRVIKLGYSKKLHITSRSNLEE